jgi:type IV pilus assembly protein PilB
LAATKNKRLGDLLVEAKVITQKQLQTALEYQNVTGEELGDVLQKLNFVTEKQITEVLEFEFGIPFVDLNNISISPSVANIIPPTIAKRHHLIPVKIDHSALYIAMEDPLNFIAIDDVRMISGMDVIPMMTSGKAIQKSINQLYANEFAEKAIEDFKKENNLDNAIKDIENSLGDEINTAPIVRLVNSIIELAVTEKSSDIHIEPLEHETRVRIRIDGRLQQILKIPKSAHSAIIARIKIMGDMNIAEKRIPQDGRVEMTIHDSSIDLRLSIIPTVHGEKAVLRILDRSNFLIPKNALGFTKKNLEKFDKLLKNPNGIILVTGPTGSGKSTTLYTMLNELNNEYDNIITIEDPVEYMIKGLNQIQVNVKAGLSFASGLRAILRQDPDIIMIGEIRDQETAEIALRAAITGHLVLSTIHTNDAVSTISRLIDMGMEPFLLAASLVGVISQRLIRKICTNCMEPYTPTNFDFDTVGLKRGHPGLFYKGSGCPQCYHTGYKGRFAIHEILPISRKHREMINNHLSIDQIRDHSIKEGMSTLRDEAIKVLLNGQTTFEEVVRLTYSFDKYA